MARCSVAATPATEAGDFERLRNGGTFDVCFGADLFGRPASSRDVYEYEKLPHLPTKQITSSKRNLAGGSVDQDPCPGQCHGQGRQASDVAFANGLKKHVVATSPSTLCRAAKPASQPFRRRPAVDSETFRPLDSLREASALSVNKHNYENTGSPSTRESPERFAEVYDLLKDTVTERSIWEQVKKHSAGQFEWLMTHLPSPDSTIHDSSSEEYATGDGTHGVHDTVYACSLVLQKKRGLHSDSECPLNSYYLLATPLQYSANWTVEMQEPRIVNDEDESVTWVDRSRPGTPPMKVPEIVYAVENAVSPTFTAVSDRSFGESSSRTTSFSLPRIEDSLEELDRLEDEIEALNDFTHSQQLHSQQLHSQQLVLLEKQQQQQLAKAGTQPTVERAANASKRSTVACAPATVRVKPTEKVSALPRRSTSLVVREKSLDEPTKASLSRRSGLGVFMSKAGSTLATVAKSSIGSSKTPTIPKFELPGKAVARRLKEVRDAREAQQAAAHKALEAPPAKPRTSKTLPRPTFELPGDTISRRKKEENEAKLKAQEEEQRKKREFKARPAKPSSTPSTLPRDTVASRARQAKIQEETAERLAASLHKVKRLSLGLVRDEPTTPTLIKTEKKRGGRSSMMAAAEEINRTVLASLGSSTKNKNLLSIGGMMSRLKPRSKEIQAQDTASINERKSCEISERPMTAKAARDEAAEHSRKASREWAERKHRKETSPLKREAEP
ncbi:uncharacterized protein TrAFT101_004916 [Trichoderma asperellum]|uniref:uncharacterized protein n=1 Tax=Trichoderma asperellum TaxID=101201 RepID=UPI00332B868C|nr:hypothetical protein TrAFT101_004916 [Trichoderma asperellum]